MLFRSFPPDLAQAASAASRNVAYVRNVILKGLEASGLAQFKAQAGPPLDYDRWGPLERFRFDLDFTRGEAHAGFGIYVYRLGTEVRYDVYGVQVTQGDSP